MSSETKIRVAIVDHHPVLREGLSSIINLQTDMCVVAEAENGHQAIELYREHRPDITLMDLWLPDIPGIEVLGRIRAEFPGARVAILSDFDGDAGILRSLRAGARGYFLKRWTGNDMLTGIRQIHCGKRHLPPEIASKLAEHLNNECLTKREIEVLGLLPEGNRNRDIAEILSISEETVKVHVKHLMEKLGANDRTQAFVMGVRRGFIRL